MMEFSLIFKRFSPDLWNGLSQDGNLKSLFTAIRASVRGYGIHTGNSRAALAWMNSDWLIFTGILVLFILLAGIFLVSVILWAVTRKKEKNSRTSSQIARPLPSALPSQNIVKIPQQKASSPDKAGTLKVIVSDDPTLVGKVLTLGKGKTRVGRSVENDIALPEDRAVSREHALFQQNGNDMYLSEVIGQEGKRPTYGTFVNDVKVEGTPVRLKTGDSIRLGLRCILTFEKCLPDMESTIISETGGFSDVEKTMDADSDSTVIYKP
jgi:pSer/pThr/pTyr-binding forkhead associated (FHA) protein